MQIHSLTRFIAAPFLIALVYIFYQSAMDYDFRDEYSWLIVPLLITCVALYIFSPQIDFWHHKRHPLALDKPIVNWLEQQFSFYRSLSETDKERFRNRLGLFMEAKEFKLVKVEQEEMPEDMTFIIAAHAIWLCFGREDYLMNKFERIFAYMHPFPTPFYKHLHTVEAEMVDGIILFAFEYVLKGLNSETDYNIALHGFADAFVESNPKLEWPVVTDNERDHLSSISGIDYQRICDTVGFERVNLQLIAIHHYLKYPSRFLEILPETYEAIHKVLRIGQSQIKP